MNPQIYAKNGDGRYYLLRTQGLDLASAVDLVETPSGNVRLPSVNVSRLLEYLTIPDKVIDPVELSPIVNQDFAKLVMAVDPWTLGVQDVFSQASNLGYELQTEYAVFESLSIESGNISYLVKGNVSFLNLR